MMRRTMLVSILGVMAGLTFSAIAQEQSQSGSPSSAAAQAPARGRADAAAATHSSDTAEERALRVEGEKRFRANCGRCHMAPHKFSPRVMATAIRHMRVRATITDEDMRLILRYMTQ